MKKGTKAVLGLLVAFSVAVFGLVGFLMMNTDAPAEDEGGTSKNAPKAVAASAEDVVLEYDSGGDVPTTTTVTFHVDTQMMEVSALASSMYQLDYEAPYSVEDNKLEIKNVKDLEAHDVSGIAKIIGLPEDLPGTAMHDVEVGEDEVTLRITYGNPKNKEEEPAQLGEFVLDKDNLAKLGINLDEVERIPVTGLTFEETELEVEVGKSLPLTAKIEPEDATITKINYMSEDAQIATVDETGRVTGVKEGTTKVKGVTEDGAFEAECTVKVKQASSTPAFRNVSVSGDIVLNYSDGKGETATMTTIAFNLERKTMRVSTLASGMYSAVYEVAYHITDGKLVIDTAYNVTASMLPEYVAVGMGQYLPTSFTQNVTHNVVVGGDWMRLTIIYGSDANLGTFTLNSSILAQLGINAGALEVVHPNGVTLDKNALELEVGKSEKLNATVTPADALNKNVWWVSSDESVATVSDGQVTAIAAGTADVTVVTEDGWHSAVCHVTVKEKEVAEGDIALSYDDGKGDTATKTDIVFHTATKTLEVNMLFVGIYPCKYETSYHVDGGKLAIDTKENVTLTLMPEVAEQFKKDPMLSILFPESVTGPMTHGLVAAEDGLVLTIRLEDMEPARLIGEFKLSKEILTKLGVNASEVKPVQVSGVALDQDALELEVGAKATLKATVSPADASNKDISWTSSNESVAKVEDGVVTAVGAGEANITVTTKDGGFAANCKVTVKEKELPPQPENGVELEYEGGGIPSLGMPTKTKIKFQADKKSLNVEALFINAYPLAYETTYRVENGELVIADVDEVTLTLLPEVEEQIKNNELLSSIFVKSVTGPVRHYVEKGTDGLQLKIQVEDVNADGTKNERVLGEFVLNQEALEKLGVSVEQPGPEEPDKPVAATGVTLDKSALELELGKTATLTATVLPADAANKTVTWKSSNELAVSVENGVVTALDEGTADVTVTTEDGAFTATCNVTAKVKQLRQEAGDVALEKYSNNNTNTETEAVFHVADKKLEVQTMYNNGYRASYETTYEIKEDGTLEIADAKNVTATVRPVYAFMMILAQTPVPNEVIGDVQHTVESDGSGCKIKIKFNGNIDLGEFGMDAEALKKLGVGTTENPGGQSDDTGTKGPEADDASPKADVPIADANVVAITDEVGNRTANGYESVKEEAGQKQGTESKSQSEPAQSEESDAQSDPAQSEGLGSQSEPAQSEGLDSQSEPAQSEGVGSQPEPAQSEESDAQSEPALPAGPQPGQDEETEAKTEA